MGHPQVEGRSDFQEEVREMEQRWVREVTLVCESVGKWRHTGHLDPVRTGYLTALAQGLANSAYLINVSQSLHYCRCSKRLSWEDTSEPQFAQMRHGA